MPASHNIIIVLILGWISHEIEVLSCYIGMEPDPSSGQFRWVIPVEDPCLCTHIKLGGVNSRTPLRTFNVTYYDSYTTSSNTTPIRDWLNCQNTSCHFHTEPMSPYSYMFILKPLRMPFRLDFSVRAIDGANVALAKEKTDFDTFAEISLGGWGNKRSVIQPCRTHTCYNELAAHEEVGILNDNELRPFWLEYKEGILKVGKGGHEESFLSADVEDYYQQIHLGISTYDIDDGDWVFNQFCE